MRSVCFTLAAFIAVATASVLPKRDLATVYSKCTVKDTVAITFDDGMFIYEEELLPLLANYSAKATFFLNGNNYACIYDDKSVQSVRNLLDSGHEIGAHTWSHAHMAQLSWDKLHHEMFLIEDALVKVAGVMPALMRPPYGEYNDRALAAIKARNQSAIIWDFDSQDSIGATVAKSKSLYDEAAAKRPDSILTLNHSVLKNTVREVLPHALEVLSKAGYKFVTVSECLGGLQPYQFVQYRGMKDDTWKC
ncbi:glycoside hydrolase/deacetylase [Exidia glandulosa HHB12029]|uniref:Glycoside hydrolase/deacetylase n=1 Tax=Exidia glandulosa HHB12029 TaxID=1314781 RepID=A0A165F1I2_EXIGL|nr:glycoside hydrolase/deacetylase [Exidia glandulosa HHB12029]